MRKPASFEQLTPYQQNMANALGAHLHDLRSTAGKTQSEIARAVGMSRVHYGNMENGKVPIGWMSYLALIFYFNENPRTHDLVQQLDLFPGEFVAGLDD